jgi:biopolymer transport protein ExbD
MVSTTFLDPERDIDLDLPQAESGEPLEVEPQTIVINVTADGRVLLGTAEVDRNALRAALEDAARRDPKTPVTIRGDRAASHGTIVGVMDACGLAGLLNLSVGTIEGS